MIKIIAPDIISMRQEIRIHQLDLIILFDSINKLLINVFPCEVFLKVGAQKFLRHQLTVILRHWFEGAFFNLFVFSISKVLVHAHGKEVASVSFSVVDGDPVRIFSEDVMQFSGGNFFSFLNSSFSVYFCSFFVFVLFNDHPSFIDCLIKVFRCLVVLSKLILNIADITETYTR
jgi:hypothetical protein